MGSSYAGEASVAAGGGVEVDVGGGRGGMGEDGTANEVADATVEGGEVRIVDRREGGIGEVYRDLKEPEGWRFSSLRKILLLIG